MKAYVYILINYMHYMTKKQGDRLNVGEVKSNIICFILENVKSVGEPAIRDFLLQKYDLMDQGNINRHLHDLQKLDCIELIPPQKKGWRNYWDIKKLKNLRKIKQEFPEVRLNDYEKSINILLLELEHFERSPNWLNFYLKLLLSPSFFKTCIETGSRVLDKGIWKVYLNGVGSNRHQHIEELLKACYLACGKYQSNFKMLEKEFTDTMKALPWDVFRFYREDALAIEIEHYLPGLPRELSSKISETRLSGMEHIPVEKTKELKAEELGKYIMNTILLIMEERLDLKFLKDDLLLQHFIDHDMLIGEDSDDELYFVRKTKENHTLSRGSTVPWQIILREAELADLKLASEMIFKYKQPTQFSDSCNNLEEVYKKVLKYYSNFQLQQ